MITLTDFLVRSGFLFTANATDEVNYKLLNEKTLRDVLEKNGRHLLKFEIWN